jgi:hypothetical protein
VHPPDRQYMAGHRSDKAGLEPCLGRF